MSRIREQLDADLRDAMRGKNATIVASIRQLKARVQEIVTAKGFSGPVDDALYERAIESYVKSLRKGIEELEAAGERGGALRRAYAAEIEYLGKYLPEKLDEDATRKLVRETIAATGATDSTQAGKVMGALMKAHRAVLDAGLAKKLVDEELSR